MQHNLELGEDEARIAIDVCVAELKRRGKAGVIAVADGHGELIALWRTDSCALPSGDARYIGWDGGAPVMHEGRWLGAVAVSGLSGQEDLDIAQLGIDAILASLAA